MEWYLGLQGQGFRRGFWWLLHHQGWEVFGPSEGGLWSWSVWVARGGFPWKDSGPGGS